MCRFTTTHERPVAMAVSWVVLCVLLGAVKWGAINILVLGPFVQAALKLATARVSLRSSMPDVSFLRSQLGFVRSIADFKPCKKTSVLNVKKMTPSGFLATAPMRVSDNWSSSCLRASDHRIPLVAYDRLRRLIEAKQCQVSIYAFSAAIALDVSNHHRGRCALNIFVRERTRCCVRNRC